MNAFFVRSSTLSCEAKAKQTTEYQEQVAMVSGLLYIQSNVSEITNLLSNERRHLP